MILRVRLLKKVIFYSKKQLFYYYRELPLKTLRKERSNWRLSLLGSIGMIPELFDKKNLNKELSSFYGAGSDRILGNVKGVGAPVFTNRKIKITKKRDAPE